MDAREMLEARHAELEDLFHEISCTRDGETRRTIFEDIAAKIALHGELVTNGPLSRSGNAVSRARVERLVAELQVPSGDDRAWGMRLQSLQEEMEQVMDELEAHLVPAFELFPRTLGSQASGAVAVAA
jgi:hypothetical protein